MWHSISFVQRHCLQCVQKCIEKFTHFTRRLGVRFEVRPETILDSRPSALLAPRRMQAHDRAGRALTLLLNHSPSFSVNTIQEINQQQEQEQLKQLQEFQQQQQQQQQR